MGFPVEHKFFMGFFFFFTNLNFHHLADFLVEPLPVLT